MKFQVLAYSIVFLAGFISCMLLTMVPSVEMPFGFNTTNLKSPGNWVENRQIHVYKDKVVIDVDGASLSRYAPTGSMLPVLNENSNGIRIVPKSSQEIEVGDIVTFEQNNQLIIHRVIGKGVDKEGTYFITKGDNSSVNDGKIRFEDIKYVTLAIVY